MYFFKYKYLHSLIRGISCCRFWAQQTPSGPSWWV